MDSLGKRYGLLPSEVLEKATTFDLEVLDIAISYETYKHDRATGKAPAIREKDLLAAVEKVRKQNADT